MSKAIWQLKKRAKKFFRQTKKVNCPAFGKGTVAFNAKGLNHLFYKGPRKGRNLKQAAIRIKMLPRAAKLLQLMPVFQEERSYVVEKKEFRFWSFEGVVDNRRIKIVIRQVGEGKKHFWSVIPSWKRIDGKIVNAKSDLRRQ